MRTAEIKKVQQRRQSSSILHRQHVGLNIYRSLNNKTVTENFLRNSSCIVT